jgi:hypothetical protein
LFRETGDVTGHASAEVPESLRSLAAEHGLPTTYELSTTVSLGDSTAQWAMNLVICDVMADMRRDLHPVLIGRPPRSA